MRILQTIFLFFFIGLQLSGQIKTLVSETHFDTTLIDEYSGLEDINSPQTQEWLKIQRKLSKKHLKMTRLKENGFVKMNKLGYIDFNLPTKQGKYYYKMMYHRDDAPPALFIQRSIESSPEIIVDPIHISSKDEISIGGVSASKDDKYLAFTYGRNGSDWREIRVKKIKGSMGLMKDKIVNAKFTAPV